MHHACFTVRPQITNISATTLDVHRFSFDINVLLGFSFLSWGIVHENA